MKRLVCLLVVAGAVLAAIVLPSSGASSEEARPARCGVEGADIIDGVATYDGATSTLTFQVTTGGASCLGQTYHVSAYDDNNPASAPLGKAVVRGDGVAASFDLTDVLEFTFNNIPAGDQIFCFVGKTNAAHLFDRAPDNGRFCFDTSGGGSGGFVFR